MSALRIRYEIMQLRPRYETHKLLPEEAKHLAILDENAFYAWAASYPHDTWLAPTGYLLAQLYEEFPGADARSRAIRALTYVKVRFPSTTYAAEATATLHRGLPIRPDPEWAASMRSARTSPTPSRSPESPLASPTASPPTSPAPSASPEATRRPYGEGVGDGGASASAADRGASPGPWWSLCGPIFHRTRAASARVTGCCGRNIAIAPKARPTFPIT
jgi:hypothetical protein